MTTTDPAPNLRPLSPGVVVPVAGISKYQDVAARVAIGEPVVLHHELDNPYDVDAVAIHTQAGDQLGHVPAGTSRLNSRLLVGHRGGVWSGIVVEKVGGTGPDSTIGLRVKILQLQGHRKSAYGAAKPGRRGEASDPDVPELIAMSTDPDTPAAAPTGDQVASSAEHPERPGSPAAATSPTTAPNGAHTSAPAEVYAAGTGRLLGVLVETSGARVRVRNAQGLVTAYPAALVTTGLARTA